MASPRSSGSVARVGRVAVAALLAVSLSALSLVLLPPPTAGADGTVVAADGEVTYKEYWVPHSQFDGGCGLHQSGPPSFYLEPEEECDKTITFDIPDNFSGADKAELYIDFWRTHEPSSPRFRVNDGPLRDPGVANDWSRSPYVVEIPLAELRQGSNSITFAVTEGLYHVHDVAVRIYHDGTHPLLPGPGSDVTPPTGSLTSVVADNGTFDPSTGGALQVDGDQLTFTADAAGGDVAFVEFHAYYDGYDMDVDGETLDWQALNRNNWNPGGTAAKASGGTINHPGTDTTAPYSATWDLAHVPNQEDVKFKARVVDNSGNVREAAGGVSAPFDLQRSVSVEAYRVADFEDAALYHGGTDPLSVSREIELPDMTGVTSVLLVGQYWNNPYIRLNGNSRFKAFEQGQDWWTLSVREVPLGQVGEGVNLVNYEYNESEIFFGQFIERPGPMVVLRRNPAAVAPPVISSQPLGVTTPERSAATFSVGATGTGLHYRWQRDGVDIPGATSASYTTPAVFGADDGSEYRVVVSNGAGSVTSQQAELTVVGTPGWWDARWPYRLQVEINSADVARTDMVEEIPVNLSNHVARFGDSGVVDLLTLRVVEVDQAGSVIDDDVAWQFDRGAGFNSQTNVNGFVTVLMEGTTPANSARRYHVYFGLTGQSRPAYSQISPLVALTDNVVDEGQESYRVATQSGTYYFHKKGGGLSSLVDSDGRDWLSYAPTGGSDGAFRGVPNAVYPEGAFHPGYPNGTSSIANQGPLKVTVNHKTVDNKWKATWDFYPTYTQVSVTSTDHNYWFQYEGTPGGTLSPTSDYVVRSNGVQSLLSQSWTGDLPGEEWAYFADGTLNRSFFMAGHEDDNIVDSYTTQYQNGSAMTVFGLGRNGLVPSLHGSSKRFSFGLTDSRDYATTSAEIRAAYRDLVVATGIPEKISGPVTPLAPSGVIAAAGDEKATVSWTPPYDGGSPVTGYTVVAEPGGATVPVAASTTTVDVPGLMNGQPYTFTVVAANALGSGPASAPSNTVYPTPARSVVSDDFNEGVLDPSVWTFEDPVGDASLEMDGTHAVIDVPTGGSHDLWTNANLAPRMLQTVRDEDFAIEAKWNTAVTTPYQMQGLVIQENPQKLLRIDFLHGNPAWMGGPQRVFAASYVNGVATNVFNSPIYASGQYLRVIRTGDQFQVLWSAEGTTWQSAGTFSFPMSVTSVGAFVANHDVEDPASSPPTTGALDYFFNLDDPIVPEDAVADGVAPVSSPPDVSPSETAVVVEWTTDELAHGRVQYGETSGYELGTTAAGPLSYRHRIVVPGLDASQDYELRVRARDVAGNEADPIDLSVTTLEEGAGATEIELFQGDEQDAWTNGNPQRWFNVLGNVSDPDGVAELSYRVNGAEDWRPLTVGADDRRLVSDGDFNADIPNSDLSVGANQVDFRVVDELGTVTLKSLSLTAHPRQIWPTTYDVTWAGVSDIADVAQPVDGAWELTPQGLRTSEPGYDRLVAIGDMEWTDYEVTVPVTLHSVDYSGYDAPSYGPGLGLLMRWDGHYKWDDRQPNWGFEPLGSIGWYRWDPDGTERLSLTNGAGNTAVSDSSGFRVQPGNTYWYKMRVETVDGSIRYTLSVWKDGQSPSTGRTLTYDAPPDSMQRGSALLVAHHVDATFGDVSVRPINAAATPVISPGGGNFGAPVEVSISSPVAGAAVHYTLDGTEPTSESPIYTGPFDLTATAEVRAVAVTAEDVSSTATKAFSISSAGITSDDFHDGAVDTSLWTAIRPRGSQQVWTDGTNARMSVPSGSPSDLWTGALSAPRLVQAAADTDFEIETKIDVLPASAIQFEGLVVQQSASTFIRADVYSTGSSLRLFAGSVSGGTGTARLNVGIQPTGSSVWLRLSRVGDTWTLRWSPDGSVWNQAGQFTYGMQVTAVGLHSASTATPASATQQFTGSFDYFFDTSAPIAAEDGGPTPDVAPVVDAGADQAVTLPDGATLDGTVTDELPAPSVTWSQLAGPASAQIADPGAEDTTTTFPVPGTYHFQLSATDGVSTSQDTVKVEVTPNPSAPVVRAGTDKQAITGEEVWLGGSASDDGLPDPLQTTWTKVSGPGTAMFDDPGSVATNVTVDQPGIYVLRLAGDDGESQSIDNVTLTAVDDRVQGALVLYDFQEGAGEVVHDLSEVGSPADLSVVASETDDYRWVTGGGLDLEEPTRIVSDGPIAKVNDAVAASGEVTVEAWVRPSNTTQFGPARIATISTGPTARDVTLGQGESSVSTGSQYTARLRTTTTNTNGTPGLATASGEVSLSMQHVVFTRDAVGTTKIYVDGNLAATGASLGDLSNWDPTFGLSLGNEPDGSRPWLGELHLVAIYDQALSAAEVATNLDHGPTLLPGSNSRPSVDAGVDQIVRLPDPVPLQGAVADDGRPIPPGAVTSQWSVVSGVGPVTFDDPTSPTTDVTFTTVGTYVLRLAATDGAKYTEDTVSIEVRPAPVAPGIIVAPQPVSLTIGQRGTFSVIASGTYLEFQWLKDGVEIPGATQATYSPPPAVLADDATTYSVRVSNELDVITTEPVSLTVRGGGRVLDGSIAFYQLDEGEGTQVRDTAGYSDPLDLVVEEPGDVTWVPGGLRLNASTAVSSPGAASKIIQQAKATGAVTVEAWVKPANVSQWTGRMVALSSNANVRNIELMQSAGTYSGRLRTSTNGGHLASVSGATTGLQHVVLTRTAAGEARVYLNGTGQSPVTFSGSLTNWDEALRLTLGNVTDGTRSWLGELHLVAFYNRALDAGEVEQNYLVGAAPSSSNNTAPIVSAGADGAVQIPGAVSLAGSVSDDGLPEVPGTVTVGWSKASGPGAVTFADPLSVSTTATFGAPGTYVLRLSASDGASSSSDDVTVEVAPAPVPPSIVTPPTNRTVVEHQPAVFTVVAQGTAPLSYQWRRDGSDLVGATSSTLTLAETSLDDDGAVFDVVVTNPVGSMTSTPAVLTVQATPPRSNEGVVAFFDFEEGTGSTVHDTSGAGAPVDLTVANPAATSWTASGLTINQSTSLVSTGAGRVNAAVAASGELTIEAWVEAANTTQDGPSRLVSLAPDPFSRNAELTQSQNKWTARMRTTSDATNSLSTQAGTATTALHHVVMTRAAGGSYVIYVDGVQRASGTASGNTSTWVSSAPLTLANVATGNRPWLGTLHMVAIYSRALSAAEVGQNRSAGQHATMDALPPSITADPVSATAIEGQTATFGVSAGGSAPLTYQWRRDGVDIPGATGASYTIEAVQIGDDGASFDVVVTNGEGSATSAAAVLTVVEAGARVAEGLVALYPFSEGAGATVADVSGAGQAVDLTITQPGNVTWTGTGLRIDAPTSLVASSGTSRINNAVAATGAVTVEAWVQPANTTQGGPARIVSIAPDPYSRNIELTQSGTRWTARVRTTTNSSHSFDTPAGTASSALQHVVLVRDPGGTYRVYVDGVQVATGVAGGALSNWASTAPLTVGNVATGDRPWLGELQLVAVYSRALSAEDVLQNFGAGPNGVVEEVPPGIASHPQSAAVTSGQTAAFGVIATGTAPLSYQWRRNGVDIPGATSALYVTEPVSESDDGAVFDVVVTNAQGSVTSSTAVLSVAVPGARVVDGIQILYEFNEGSGSSVADSSGAGAPAGLAMTGATTWVPGGVSVDGASMLTSAAGGEKVRAAVGTTGEFTVETWVSPSTASQWGGRLFSIAPDPWSRNVDLFQNGTVYEGRVRTSTSASSSTVSPAGVAAAGLQHVVYTRSADGTTRLYVDGILRDTRTGSGVLTTWTTGLPLVLGNVSSGGRGWSGTFHLFAMYDRALEEPEILQNLAAGP